MSTYWKIKKQTEFGVVTQIQGSRCLDFEFDGKPVTIRQQVLCVLSEELGEQAASWTKDQDEVYLAMQCNVQAIDAQLLADSKNPPPEEPKP